MKRFSIVLFIFFAFIFSLTARTSNDKSKDTVEIFIDVNNIPESEQNWLGFSVADKLETNLFTYADFSFINSVNKKQILDIQRAYEGAAYDENSSIEVGKLHVAKYGLFVTIKKGGSKYSLTVRYTDLTTGKIKATAMEYGDSPEALYAVNGSTADLITIDLCNSLGIYLSPTEKQIIMNGEKDLTVDEKARLYDEKIQLFEKQIDQIDKEIEYYSVSGEIDATYYKEQLEAKRKLADEKLNVARKNQIRAEEDAQRKREDEERNAKRSEEQRERINLMSQELSSKYETLREKKFENEPILGKIKVIELKKKALLDIQADIDGEIEKLNTEANEKINEKLNEIKNAPIAVAEQGDSADVLSDVARKNRARDFEDAKKEIINNLKKDAKQINDKLIKENKKLLDEIHKDYSSLKTVTVSSLSDDLIVDYGSYDGNRNGWPLYITVKSDEIIIFNTTSFLSYKELSGNDPIIDSRDPNYKDFAIDVDTYESMFLRGEPILTYEVEYVVSPYPPEHPSKYKFKFNYLKYYDTRTMSVWGNKLRASKTGFLHLDSDTVSRQFSPIYDIRAIEANQTASIKVDNIVYDIPEDNDNSYYDFDNYTDEDYFNYIYDQEKYERERYLEEQKRIEREMKELEKARKKEEHENEDIISGYPTDHTLFGINAGFGMEGLEGPSLEIELDFAILDFIYWGLSSTSYFPVSASGYYVIPDISYLMTNQVKLGVNLDLFFCNVYSSAGIGFNYFTYMTSWAEDSSYVPKEIPNDFRFCYTVEVGCSLDIFDSMAVSCAYMLVFYDENKHGFHNLDFGLAFTF